MPRDKTIKILRTTRATLNQQKAANNLLLAEPYFITDEARLAIGTADNDYVDFAKTTEVSGSGLYKVAKCPPLPDGFQYNNAGDTEWYNVPNLSFTIKANTLYRVIFNFRTKVSYGEFGLSSNPNAIIEYFYLNNGANQQFVQTTISSASLYLFGATEANQYFDRNFNGYIRGHSSNNTTLHFKWRINDDSGGEVNIFPTSFFLVEEITTERLT